MQTKFGSCGLYYMNYREYSLHFIILQWGRIQIQNLIPALLEYIQHKHKEVRDPEKGNINVIW